MRDEFIKQLETEMEEIGLLLTSRQKAQFYDFYRLLISWNSKMNLTAITEWTEVITKHFVDCLSLIRVIPDLGEKNWSVIDVGTGAGFPGIPLKIAFPDLRITLLDSLNKRIVFLNQVVEDLELKNIEAVHGRAEDFAKENVSRETFDLCVSRAVANLSTLSEYCIPFVKVGGMFISYKSGKSEEEIRGAEGAVKKLGGEINKMDIFQLPNSDERCLVKINKISKCKKIYPRKAGIPSRQPLK